MTVHQLLDAGDLPSAIAQVGQDLRTSPGDYAKRTALFELLCCAGDLDRAAKHLEVMAGESTDRAIAVQPYRNLLEGERKRRRLFTDGLIPGLPKSMPEYTRLHLESINRVRENQYNEARALLEEAASLRRGVSGSINGEPFEDLTDADDLIGPFLEVIVGDTYSWVPWEVVRSVTTEAPRHLRDLIWLPADVELDLGPLGHVFLPVLYANSYLHEDSRVKLGRMTDWRSDVPGLALAAGQKLLMADEREWPLLEIRQLEIQPVNQNNGDSGAGN
jgi:type VI secretion system protein ImpE